MRECVKLSLIHMKSRNAFVLKKFKEEGIPGAIAVLCSEEETIGIAEYLDRIPPFMIPQTSDPSVIDLALAEYVSAVTPAEPHLCAAVVRPDIMTDLSCGAVIGMSQSCSRTAEQRLTEIYDGLWCWAYPGICGFILYGTRKEAEDCVDCIYASIMKRHEPWQELAQRVRESMFLYVSDSIGKECFTKGILAAGDGKGAFVYDTP